MPVQRGRKGQKVTLIPQERPEPLPELTPEEAEEWRAVVNRMPADWFPPETHGVLAQYCRHRVNSRRCAELAERYWAGSGGAAFDMEEYDRLLKMLEREGRAVTAHARSMRLTLQSTYDKSKSKKDRPAAGGNPWDA